MSNQNQKKPDQQQNQGQKPGQPADNKKAETSKAEIKKAVEQDEIDPNNPQGNQNTGYSGGS